MPASPSIAACALCTISFHIRRNQGLVSGEILVFFITAVQNRGKSGGRKVDPMEALEGPESSPSLTGGLTYLPTVAGSALPSALYVNTISNMYYTYMPPPHPSQPLVCLFTQPTPTFCTAHTSQHDCNLLTRLPQLNLTCAS